VLDKETRAAILLLHGKGHSQRAIAGDLRISRESVQKVIESGTSEVPERSAASRLMEYVDDIRYYHADCKGNLMRVAQKLKEEKGLSVSYPSLTWFCRKNGIGVRLREPAQRIITDPGEEMQHDTSPYTIEIGGKRVKCHGASLVLGHSRLIYLQFYRKFNRFHVKAFLTKAFQYIGGVCLRCVIDNSSVVLACGAGANAQVAPEMEAFEKRFGFHFLAHGLGHADRSGKVERPFDYVENNFLVGRRFKDDADLNAQALEWMEKTANPRILREFRASPMERFAVEKPHLVPLPLYIPEAYQIHRRLVDAYSCVSVDEFKYPVPPAYIDREVLVRETLDKIVVLDGHREIAVHNKKYSGSEPLPTVPLLRRARKAPAAEEPKLLALGEGMKTYLDALKKERGPRYNWSLRKLFELMCQYDSNDLLAAVETAARHRLFDVRRVETVLLQNLAERDYRLPLGFQEEHDS
jgi:transposase